MMCYTRKNIDEVSMRYEEIFANLKGYMEVFVGGFAEKVTYSIRDCAKGIPLVIIPRT